MEFSDEDERLLKWVKENRPKLERLLEHADFISEDFEYRAAKALVWSTWRKAVIGFAGLLAALLVIYTQGRQIFAWMVKGVM